MFLGDFHIHSTFSDGVLTIPQIVDYFGQREFGAIAITDHLCEDKTILGKASAYLGKTLTRATFPLYREILKSEAERAWDQYRMVLIPGVEITRNSVINHRSAHLLSLGTLEYICADGLIENVIDEIHSFGGLAVAAHPVWTGRAETQTFQLWDRREELAEKMDAWEIASGSIIFEPVKNSGLPVLANSDFHSKRHMNSWKTTFSCERKTGAILDAVKRQAIGLHFYREARANGSFPLDFALRLDSGFGGYSLGNLARL